MKNYVNSKFKIANNQTENDVFIYCEDDEESINYLKENKQNFKWSLIMLLEFRVANYRSIRDEQVLNLIASSDDALADTHLAATGLKSAPHAVRSAVVYGPNASGKSTLLNILGLLDLVVATALGVTAAPGLAHVLQLSPSTAQIALLPLVLIPTTLVPLAATLHIVSLRRLPAVAPAKSTPIPVGA